MRKAFAGFFLTIPLAAFPALAQDAGANLGAAPALAGAQGVGAPAVPAAGSTSASGQGGGGGGGGSGGGSNAAVNFVSRGSGGGSPYPGATYSGVPTAPTAGAAPK